MTSPLWAFVAVAELLSVRVAHQIVRGGSSLAFDLVDGLGHERLQLVGGGSAEVFVDHVAESSTRLGTEPGPPRR